MADKDNRLPAEQERRRNPENPAGLPLRPGQRLGRGRKGPFLPLFAFYALIVGIALVLIYYLPVVYHAWVAAPEGQAASGLSLGNGADALRNAVRDQGPRERVLSVLLITLGSLAISLPVAWVYTYVRRLRYDPSLVHSVIILPMVVSGIVVIVKDSVALAFSLAGIVAAVRFRNTLKDPKDAVYIFLALGIGLAAGVQALDIALVLSIVFNTVVLVLWRYNFGAMYGDARGDILAVGDRNLMIARSAGQRDAIRWRLSQDAKDMKTDGILLVHSQDPEAARQGLELTLSKTADDWRFADNFRRRNGVATFAVLLRMKEKKGDPLALLADIDERWSQEIEAAEYVPFKKAADKSDE